MPKTRKDEEDEKDEEEFLDNEEEIRAETEKLDFTKGDFVFIPKGNCQYRQNGPYLVCYSCDLKHAVYIGMEKMMVGEDKEGKPILKRRDLK